MQSFTKLSETEINPQNTNNVVKAGFVNGYNVANTADNTGRQLFKFTDTGPVFGVGVAYDQISNIGTDFSQQQIGVIIDSNLTTNSPHSAYMFVHAKSTLNYSPSGIAIQN